MKGLTSCLQDWSSGRMLCCSWNFWGGQTRWKAPPKFCYLEKKILAAMQHLYHWGRVEIWSRRMTLKYYLRLMFTCGNTKEGQRHPSLSKWNLFLGNLVSGHCELVMPVAFWSTHIKLPVIMERSAFNIKYHSCCRAKTEDRPFPFSLKIQTC